MYRVRTWLRISPPTIAKPSGLRSSDPAPFPNISGRPLSSAAIVVIRMGRKRSRQAWRMAFNGVSPSSRSAEMAKSTIMMPFFLTMPISRITPISAMTDRS